MQKKYSSAGHSPNYFEDRFFNEPTPKNTNINNNKNNIGNSKRFGSTMNQTHKLDHKVINTNSELNSINDPKKSRSKLKPINEINVDLDFSSTNITDIYAKRNQTLDSLNDSKERLTINNNANFERFYYQRNTATVAETITQSTFRLQNHIKNTIILKNDNEKIKSIDFHTQVHFLSKKLQILAEKSPDNPTFKKSQVCCEFLNLISKNEGKYHEEMIVISKEIFNSIFCTNNELIEKLENHIIGVRSLSVGHPLPYYKIIEKIMIEIDKIIKEYENTIMDINSKYSTLKKEYFDMEKRFLTQIEENNNNNQEKLAIYEKIIDDLKYELAKKSKDNQKTEEELKGKIEILQCQTKNSDDNVAREYMLTLGNLVKKIKNLEERNEVSNTENDNLKEKLNSTMESYKTCLIKLRMTKEYEQELKTRIKNLELENDKLSVRAAVGFENLTPRPDLNPILGFFSIEPQKTNSIDKVNLIYNKIKEFKESLSDPMDDLQSILNKIIRTANRGQSIRISQDKKKLSMIPKNQAKSRTTLDDDKSLLASGVQFENAIPMGKSDIISGDNSNEEINQKLYAQ